ncbi:SDR family oxidoreductase [Erythrobacter sp. HKB08]|uniref:SDR family oxidoreductase n=1 Tax=Erythrobacter sp. HKB08 TaxID=2502843 RepID=UPI001008DB43|nr:SDR family oxidoreductase [Erythrobacter sp. HKB08]
MSDWSPRNAVVTGGASGIGLAIAKELAGRGIPLLIADRNEDALAEAAKALGESATIRRVDVSDSEAVEALADQAFEQFGQVDLVLNNAGVGGPRGPVWEMSAEDARAHFDINFWGVWNGCRAFAKRLVEQDGPSAIYNTGSENSFFCAMDGSPAYIAAKHAVLGLTEALRCDLPDHVHAGLIIPGWVFTPLGPERFMQFGMEVGDYAKIVVPQILARERFVVSHSYNAVRIAERIGELMASYEKYAPRHEGDDAHDVRTVIAALQKAEG